MDRRILQRGTLLFVLLLAFAIRSSGLTAQSLWRDEVDALRFSRAPFATLANNFRLPGWNGPLFYVCFRIWIAFAGSSELALRYFSLFFGVLGVALIYRLGRTWFSPLVGGLAALLITCSPYMIWYSQEAKMYALLCALAMGTLYAYHCALRSGDWRVWTTVIVLAWITAGVHIMGALLVPVMILLFFTWWPFSRKRWRQALLALGGVILPGIVVSPWVFPLLARGGNIGHRFVPLFDVVTTMLYAFSRGILASGGLWPMGLTVFALLAGSTLWPNTDLLSRLLTLLRGKREPATYEGTRGRHLYVLALWVWLVVPILGLYAISLRIPMFVDRYLIWIGPALYLLMARGLDQIRRRSTVVSITCLAAILGFNWWSAWNQSTTSIKSDFRTAAAYVREHRQSDELILFHISYVRETFEYYYGDSSPTADGIPTDDQTPQSAVDATMRERIAGHDVVWLVLSEPEMWDPRGMTVAWLDAHARPEMRFDFTRVSVVKYQILQDLP